MYQFELVEAQDPFLERVSYGILEKECKGNIVQEVAFIPNISGDKAFVEQLILCCERNQLSPIHLLDVVTDALS